jgi:hypothetical protein
MRKQVLASIHEICEQLDAIGMYKEANDLTIVMKKIANRGDRATVEVQSDGKPVVIITRANGNFERRLGYKINGEFQYFNNLQHAINYARKIDPNAEVPATRPRKVGPTGKSWTRDDQEMFDFEASREEKLK